MCVQKGPCPPSLKFKMQKNIFTGKLRGNTHIFRKFSEHENVITSYVCTYYCMGVDQQQKEGIRIIV